MFTLPLGGREIEDMERGMIKLFEVGEMKFSVVIEKGTSEKCHQNQ